MTEQPGVVAGLVRAIGRAEHLLRSDVKGATAAVLRVVPSDPARMARIVALYAPAVPSTPAVEARRITRELTFYPAGGATPTLAGIDVRRFVLGGGGGATSSPPWLMLLACALGLGIALLAVLAETRAFAGESG